MVLNERLRGAILWTIHHRLLTVASDYLLNPRTKSPWKELILQLKFSLVNQQIASLKQYCNSLVQYSRRKTIEVKIGDLAMGGNNPIRVQSMTTIDTMDMMGSVEQTIRMVQSGCE
jgi:hypothetical protein